MAVEASALFDVFAQLAYGFEGVEGGEGVEVYFSDGFYEGVLEVFGEEVELTPRITPGITPGISAL